MRAGSIHMGAMLELRGGERVSCAAVSPVLLGNASLAKATAAFILQFLTLWLLAARVQGYIVRRLWLRCEPKLSQVPISESFPEE